MIMLVLNNKFYAILISIWLVGCYFVTSTYRAKVSSEKRAAVEIEYLQGELNAMQQKLMQLQSINNQLLLSTSNISSQYEMVQNELFGAKQELYKKSLNIEKPMYEPGLEYEQLRRKIETQARELTYFTSDQLHKVTTKLPLMDQIPWKNVIDRFGDQSRLMLASIRNLTRVDGYQPWREQEHRRLSKLMQKRLHYIQNPSRPCTDVRRIRCNLNKGCGYGCEIHHAMHCFHIAYALGRPMVLLSEGWRYNPGGFEEVFRPLSLNCTASIVSDATSWENYRTADVVHIPIIDDIYPRKDFMPTAIPEDLSERLIRLHGNPFVWFTGQLMKYLLRPQVWLVRFIQQKQAALKLTSPIVGIHVRRTDKIDIEASRHDISEYMKHVEEYYIIYQYQNPYTSFVKRVYIATDDPLVINETRTRYPDYEFYGDENVAQSAQPSSRYGPESLKGIILDIRFLSLCDYLVCTFSSQVCRVAYELMQQRVTDAAWRVQPLDDVYYFGGQNPHYQRAVVSHRSTFPGEFSFESGDIIRTEGNHWNGFSKGTDTTNGQSGLYPSYKTEEIVSIAKMYSYSELRLNEDEL